MALLQVSNNFFFRGHGRPHLPHDDARPDVGQACSLFQRSIGEGPEAEDRYGSVSGPSNVEHFPRLGGNVHRGAVGAKKTHSLPSPRDQNALAVHLLKKDSGGPEQVFFALELNTRGFLYFLKIRSDNVAAAIALVPTALGVHDYALSVAFGLGNG